LLCDVQGTILKANSQANLLIGRDPGDTCKLTGLLRAGTGTAAAPATPDFASLVPGQELRTSAGKLITIDRITSASDNHCIVLLRDMSNMRQMQDTYEAYYFVADWHALTSDWQDTSRIRQFTEEMVLDWIAAGIDPGKATIYRQSDVPEVAELTLYLSMVTPMSWLERVPRLQGAARAESPRRTLATWGSSCIPLCRPRTSSS